MTQNNHMFLCTQPSINTPITHMNINSTLHIPQLPTGNDI